MRKRIKEVIRLIVGSALIGMSAVIILGGAILGLCKGSYPESMAFWLFTIFYLTFALFLGTSLITHVIKRCGIRSMTQVDYSKSCYQIYGFSMSL